MLRATASAALIAALRSGGKFREGNRIGKLLLQEGASNFTRTIAYFEMAYNLAEMEEELDQALEYAQQALDLAPDELKQFPLAAKGWVHYKRKEYVQAVECLEKSNDLGSSPTTLTHLGMAFLAAGNEDKAARRLRPGERPRASRRGPRGEDDGMHARLVAPARTRAAAAEAIAAETKPLRSETPVTLVTLDSSRLAPAAPTPLTRWSRTYLFTTREVPNDAEVISHQLMLRAGMIRKIAAGIYTYLPLGLAQPAEAVGHRAARRWTPPGRSSSHARACSRRSCGRSRGAGRNTARSCCASATATTATSASDPTHEEVVTDLVRRDVNAATGRCRSRSTRSRPSSATRTGRASACCATREFLMKDAYSFDATRSRSTRATREMYAAYCRIFERCGLDYLPSRPRAARSAATPATSSWSRPKTARHRAPLRRLRLRGQPENGRQRGARATVAAAATAPLSASRHPGHATIEQVTAFLGVPETADHQDADLRGRRDADRRAGPRRSRGQRGQDRRRAERASSRWPRPR